MEVSPLPTPQEHVKLQLLDGGNCMMPTGLIIDKAPMTPYKGYDWVIYIHHPAWNRHVLWDVGMVAVSSLGISHILLIALKVIQGPVTVHATHARVFEPIKPKQPREAAGAAIGAAGSRRR